MYENTHVPGPARSLLEVRELRLRAADLADLISRFDKGEIVGMGGLVGAGRTELAKSIFGDRKSYGGEV